MSAGTKRELAEFARKYSVEELGLDVGHAFETYDENTYGFYCLYWSPKTKLKVRCETAGNRTQAILKRQFKSAKNDTELRISEVVGGYGDCPVTKSLLNLSAEEIAYAIPHEKWHDYVLEFSDIKKNLIIEETGADAIGSNEGIEIVKRFYGDDSREHADAKQQREWRLTVAKTINPFVLALNELYESDMAYKDMMREKRRMFKEFNASNEGILGYKIRNNADLADSYTYHALYPLTDDIYNKHGRKRAMGIFISALKKSQRYRFETGVEELLRYSDLDRDVYGRAINVFA